jgi:type I restriction enzyme S subunit
MDALISQTEKLIEKKKAIKQGAMQELLKPKEGWVTKKLGDIVGISKGQQLNRSTLKSNGNYPVYNGGVSPSGYTNQYNTVENTIIISEGGNSCGFVNYVTSKFWRGGHCYQISPSIHHNFKFIFYYLKFEEPNIMALRVGSGLPNIQSSRLKDFLIHYPNIEIQNEIVLQLNDIFDEIDIIVNKLNKLKQQKQGMMQVLLTGKIRLIS